jgi:hypothetical protein
LFSLTLDKRYPLGFGIANAIHSNLTHGPTHGGGFDLHVNASMNVQSCSFPSSYSCNGASNAPSNACANELCGVNMGVSVTITELEVWTQQ